LTVLNERFDLALPVDGADTVSGYVWHQLGRVPAVGDTVPLVTAATPAAESGDDADLPQSRTTLRVDSVDGTLVDRVSFMLPADQPDEDPT
jgi:CBS domain containing-hemolysin-like protein